MKKRNLFKLAALTAVFALGSMFANAQVVTPNITPQTPTIPGQVSTPTIPGGSIKVIDNKGTIKYLQVQNGITQVTNTATSNGAVVTTWQLGGSLVENTYIDVNGKAFALDGIAITSVAASTNATTGSSHGTGSGWTLLVRNEATGAIEKMLASTLVNSGHQLYEITNAGNANPGTGVTYDSGTSTYTFSFTGLTFPAFKNVYVYRNGAKLIADVDYKNVEGGTSFTITTTADLPIYTGDKIELHFIK